ncbi:hypothetical protein AAEX28_09490 [Lentisphaerota bacterium WC36G]|nr:hypothetical protein LJT99_12330 [Lentisphaerae bacterium WC36]
MDVKCESCNQNIVLDDSYDELSFDCPKCGNKNIIADENATHKRILDMGIDEGDFIPEPFMRVAASIQDEVIEEKKLFSFEKSYLVPAIVLFLIAAAVQIFVPNFSWTISFPLYILVTIIGFLHLEKNHKAVAITIFSTTVVLPITIFIINLTRAKDVDSQRNITKTLEQLEQEELFRKLKIAFARKNFKDQYKTHNVAVMKQDKVNSIIAELEKQLKTEQQIVTIKESTSKINKAFGVHLGKDIPKELIVKKHEDAHGIVLYEIKADSFRKFSQIFVGITPKTNKIHTIIARATFTQQQDALIEQQNLTIVLEEQYSEKMMKPSYSNSNNHMLIHEDRYIVTKVKDNTLELIYNDEALQEIAHKERLVNVNGSTVAQTKEPAEK